MADMSEQHNVVVCLTDMLRSSAVGCYGNDHVRFIELGLDVQHVIPWGTPNEVRGGS